MIVDLGNKIVVREEVAGQFRSVGFIDYTEVTEDYRVVTGQIESLPHLDPYLTGERLLRFLREKYPRSDWSLDTEETVCRPEYVAMIERGIAEGYDYYDFIGLVADDTQAAPPTSQLWGLLAEIDRQIEEAASANPA